MNCSRIQCGCGTDFAWSGDTAAERLREFAGLAASVLHKPIDGERLARTLVEAVGR